MTFRWHPLVTKDEAAQYISHVLEHPPIGDDPHAREPRTAPDRPGFIGQSGYDSADDAAYLMAVVKAAGKPRKHVKEPARKRLERHGRP